MQHVNRKPPTAATEDPLGFVDPLAALLAGGTDDPLGTASGGNNGGGAGGMSSRAQHALDLSWYMLSILLDFYGEWSHTNTFFLP